MIYNGPSIYNQGGGGYKDGGALVDGDFIKVENNTVSSYDNVSRDPINLYFEPKDGEILNAIVELTTAVNSTVNVYVLRNGFYYLLGNVGGDTVTAGNDYKVNITGDSFAIEQVTGGGSDPEAVNLFGKIYKCKKFSGLLWLLEDFRGGSEDIVKYDTEYTSYYKYATIRNANLDGWRLPTNDEITSLRNTYSSDDLKSNEGWNGTNASGFNYKPYGNYNVSNGTYYGFGTQSITMYEGDNTTLRFMYLDTNGAAGVNTNTAINIIYYPVRLVKPYP